MKKIAATFLFLFSFSVAFANSYTLADLDRAIQDNHWNEAAQMSQEMLEQNPNQPVIRLKSAYALFQKNFSNSALVILSQITPQQWHSLPEGQERLAEITALLQKRVPLNLVPVRMEQINIETASPFLVDEIRFTKGRTSFEQGRISEAKQLLESVPVKSRFFAQAHYILATIAVNEKNYKVAQTEFSRVFEPTAFSQGAELWKDINTQFTSHWGPSLKVAFDGDLLSESKRVGELTVLGLARIAYAQQDFARALEHYSKIDPASFYFPRASLERIWTLLNLNRHAEAAKEALDLSISENSFESIEARVLRAVVLVDAGNTVEARKQIDDFNSKFDSISKSLSKFDVAPDLTTNLPIFIQNELKNDHRLTLLYNYQKDLEKEMKTLDTEDFQLFPSYRRLKNSLQPLLAQAQSLYKKIVAERVATRRKNLSHLQFQAMLIEVEANLEDREKLRTEFTNAKEITEKMQLDHDLRLTDLLKKSVTKIEQALQSHPEVNEAKIDFRQSELLWELGNVTTILSQVAQDRAQADAADKIKEKAIALAQKHLTKYPQFLNRPQVMFFVGFAQNDMGKFKDGQKTLEEYTRVYPQHQHVPDAYRILGDALFDANDFKRAEANYKKILEFRQSTIVGYALYKIGWCAYNTRDFAKALLALEKAIVWSHDSSKEKQVLSLQRESERDLITLYAELGDHRKAREYFSQFVPGETKPWLTDLAHELDRIGQYDKSGDIYRLLLVSNPTHDESIAFNSSIIFGLQQLHRWPELVQTAQTLVQNLGGKPIPVQPADSTIGATEKILREAVMAQQFEHQKRASPESEERVTSLDNAYLSIFTDWPESQLPLYQHAHFLLTQKKDSDAAIAFSKHWTQFNSGLKEPTREEALRNLIASLNQIESPLPEANSLSPSAADILKYSQIYEKEYSKAPQARAISYLRPALLFKYHQNSEATTESQKLFELNPTDEIGQRCFADLRSIYYKNKNWESTYKWASTLLESKDSKLSKYVSDLKVIKEESFFLWADGITDDNSSAEKFLQLASDPDTNRLKAKSLYNAFVRKNKAGKNIEALAIVDKLEKLDPHFENLMSVAGVRAALLQDAGDYEKSAPLLEAYLSTKDAQSNPQIFSQTLLNAALIAEGLGQNEKASIHFKKYLKEFPNEVGATEAKRALDRMQPPAKPAKIIEPPKWIQVQNKANEYEKRPIPKGNDLADRIQKGANGLEALSKSIVEITEDPKIPTPIAFEAYCKLPFLYDAYQTNLIGLADDKKIAEADRAELKAELLKIAAPILEKSKEFASECLKRGSATEHDGPIFNLVLQKWGWQNDLQKKKLAGDLLNELKSHSPWTDPAPLKQSESEITQMHINGKASEETWYTLAKIRWDQGKKSLSRLTLVDAIQRGFKSGRVLNLLAVIEASRQSKSVTLYKAAGEQGSAAAWANVAIYHLNGNRLEVAQEALQKALDSKTFGEFGSVAQKAKEITSK
jgi:TolA-binding protein